MSTPALSAAASPSPARSISTALCPRYIGICASGDTVTLLDINNSVPKYIYDEDISGKVDYKLTDTFMGFHCGNTPPARCAATAPSSTS